MTVELATIEARNLNNELPRGIRPFMRAGERALIVVVGFPGAIVATSERVIVERIGTPLRPVVFRYDELTGAVARIKVLGRRFVALTRPGLDPNPGVVAIGRSSNATIVQLWRLGQARQAVAELNELIAAKRERPAETDEAPDAAQGLQALEWLR